jgi:hypothetical protein
MAAVEDLMAPVAGRACPGRRGSGAGQDSSGPDPWARPSLFDGKRIES